MIRGTKRTMVSEPDTGTPNKNKIDLALMAKIHNRWDVEVVDAVTGEVKQRARGYNVICNGWWSTIPPGDSFSYIAYGRGTGTPAATDTALFSQIGQKSLSSGSEDLTTLSQGFISWRYSIQLAPADAVGETITEVGLVGSASSYTLLTHALLEDMNGNPISITKTSTDIVNIYATVFLHITTDRYANGKIRVTRLVSWMRGYTTQSTYMGIRILPSAWGYTGYAVSFAASSYNAATKTKTLNFSQFSAESGNHSGGALCLAYGTANSSWVSDLHAWLLLFPASKSQILSEAVGTGNGTTQNFRTKFAFPTDATVYVDGVAQTSGVTVYPDHPAQSDRLDHFLAPIAVVTSPDKLVLFDDVLQDSTGEAINPGEEHAYENVVDGLEITSLRISGASSAGNATIYVSDDLDSWTNTGATLTTDSWWTIPAQYAGSKYWKIKNNKTSGSISLNGGKNADLTSYAIRFDSPPAAGAVITADYKTPMIPKDDNHLMDISMTVTFGEYSGEEI